MLQSPANLGSPRALGASLRERCADSLLHMSAVPLAISSSRVSRTRHPCEIGVQPFARNRRTIGEWHALSGTNWLVAGS